MVIDGWSIECAKGVGADYRAGSWHDHEYELHVTAIACDSIPLGNVGGTIDGPFAYQAGGYQLPWPSAVAVYHRGQTGQPLDLSQEQQNSLCQLACEEQEFMARLGLYFAWHGAVHCLDHYGSLPKGWVLRYEEEK